MPGVSLISCRITVATERFIYLASGSPRRRELLQQIGVAFVPLAAEVTEIPQADETPQAYVTRLARAKADAGLAVSRERGLAPAPILAADTEVVLDGEILGKPRDATAAAAMLARLAGRTHNVLTAIALVESANGDARRYDAVSESAVSFAALTPAEIARYCETPEPYDKAGGYAIQGRAGAFVRELRGSYSGVVGLPLYELVQGLKAIGWARE